MALKIFSSSCCCKGGEAAWVSFTFLILPGSNIQKKHLITGARNQGESQSSKKDVCISADVGVGVLLCLFGSVASFGPHLKINHNDDLYCTQCRFFGLNNRMNCHVAAPLPFQPARD